MGGGSIEGGLRGAISHSSSSLLLSHHSLFLSSPVRQGDGFGSGDPGFTAEGGSGACFFRSGVLQPHVRGYQGVGRLEAYHRPLSPQQLHRKNEVQDGDHPICPTVSSQERLDGLHRPQGRISPNSHSSSEQEIPSFCGRRRDLAVQVSLLRPYDGATGVHSGDGPGFQLSPSSRDQDYSVPRRLADSCGLVRKDRLGEGSDIAALPGTRNCSQFCQVSPNSISGSGVLGGQAGLRDFQGFADTQEDRKVLLNSRRISVLKASVCEVLGGSSGPPGLPDPSRSWRPAPNEVTPIDSQEELGFRGRGGSDLVGRLCSGRSSVVVRRRSSRAGDVSGPPHSRPDVVVRRLRSGMGSHVFGPVQVRSLVSRRVSPVHQYEGTSGGGKRSVRAKAFSTRGSSGCLLRQHDSHLLSSQTGRHSVSVPERGFTEDPEVVRGSESCSLPTVCYGQEQRGSGCPLQTRSDSRVRVDPPSGRIRQSSQEMACDDRSFRDLSISPLFVIFCSHVGPDGGGNGCDASALERSSGLRLSTVRHDSSGVEQDHVLIQPNSDINRSLLAGKGVVPRPSVPASGTSSSSSRAVGLAEATPHSEVSSEAVHASASCVETLERFARASGFSTRVAKQLSRSRRKSSLRAYQSKWSVYRRWCWDKGHSVSRPTIPKVAEFLLWLWSSKGLGVSAIKGYRSMLSAVFSFRLPDLSESRVLRDLIRSFCIEKPRSRFQSPSWDLDLVLKALMSDAYEPLESQTLRTLTKKVLFLVALATAKRVGELQGLSNVVSSLGEDLVVSYMPFFLAKTESCLNPLPRSFVVKSLASFAFGLEEGSLLCPVRALRIYLKRTKGLSKRSSALFVSPRCPTRAISKNAISFFLREVISGAGAVRGSEGQPLRAHSIRGVSASVAFLRNQSVSKVLEAASWKTNSVFASFYFKDICFSLGEWRSLGPFVAAGSIISP